MKKEKEKESRPSVTAVRANLGCNQRTEADVLNSLVKPAKTLPFNFSSQPPPPPHPSTKDCPLRAFARATTIGFCRGRRKSKALYISTAGLRFHWLGIVAQSSQRPFEISLHGGVTQHAARLLESSHRLAGDTGHCRSKARSDCMLYFFILFIRSAV